LMSARRNSSAPIIWCQHAATPQLQLFDVSTPHLLSSNYLMSARRNSSAPIIWCQHAATPQLQSEHTHSYTNWTFCHPQVSQVASNGTGVIHRWTRYRNCFFVSKSTQCSRCIETVNWDINIEGSVVTTVPVYTKAKVRKEHGGGALSTDWLSSVRSITRYNQWPYEISESLS
jgi:hypothetical protein